MNALNDNSANDKNTNASNVTILVTGATGLVGSHLVAQLVKLGRQVRAIYRGTLPNFPYANEIEWIKGDILDIASLDTAMAGITQVYHCAAMVLFDPSKKTQLFKTNIEGTANVVNVALQHNVKKLCYVSSVAALGKNLLAPAIDETMHWTEEYGGSIYGKSKYFAELEVWRGFAEGLPCVIVNPSIILGAGEWNSGSSKIFRTAYNEFPFYTEGMTGFVDVEDVAKVMITLMEGNITGERFIVSAENRFYKDVFSLIATNFNKKPPTIKVGARLANIVRIAGSIRSKISGLQPLLTKETVEAAQSVVNFDNGKLLQYLPAFEYRPIEETITSVCSQLKQKYNL